MQRRALREANELIENERDKEETADDDLGSNVLMALVLLLRICMILSSRVIRVMVSVVICISALAGGMFYYCVIRFYSWNFLRLTPSNQCSNSMAEGLHNLHNLVQELKRLKNGFCSFVMLFPVCAIPYPEPLSEGGSRALGTMHVTSAPPTKGCP